MTDSDLAEIVEISGFRLDRGRRLLTRSNGKPVPLPTKAFDTLLYLVSHPGRVVDKHDLLDAVWPGITVEENTLNHAISAIRRALGDQRSKPRYIATIQGRGYQFVATVTTKTGSSAEPDMFGRMRRGTVVTMGATAGIVALAVLLTLSGFVPSRLLNSKDFTAYEVGLTTILTNDSGLELDPALSPDGLFYAYTDGPIGQTDIFVRSVAGDEAFNLTQNLAGTHSWPRWSPDGEEIAFVTRQPRAHDVIRIAPVWGDGDIKEHVRAPNITGHAWSPDGLEIVYTRSDKESGLYRKAVDSHALGVLLATAVESHSPVWSPDGTQIAFVSGNSPYAIVGEAVANIAPSQVLVVSANTGEAQPVTEMTSLYASPVWAADSRSLFVVSDRDGMRDVYQVALPGSDGAIRAPTRLTTGLNAHTLGINRDGDRLIYSEYTSRANIWRLRIPEGGPDAPDTAEQMTQGNQTIESLDISPDGEWLTFDSNLNGNQDIYKMSLSSQEITQLTDSPRHDFAPRFTPDSQQILFHSFRSDNRDVFIMSADGRDEQQLTFDPTHERYPDMSPDGGHIVLMSDKVLAQQVFVMSRNADGEGWSELKQITFGGGWWPKYSPDGDWIAYSTVSRGENAMLKIQSPEENALPTIFDLGSETRVGYPVWSRDSRIVYAKVYSGDSSSSIWAFPIYDGEPHELVNLGRLSPSGWDRLEFAADDTHFYFTLAERESDVRLLELVELK